MDLRGALLRRTRPRPFVVTGVGGGRTRLAVERALRLYGWKLALSPGEANMLVVCAPTPGGLDEVVDRLWDQLPGPRARTNIAEPDQAEPMLQAAAAMLIDWTHQRRDAENRAAATPTPDDAHPDADAVEHTGGHSGHEPAGHAGHQMAGHGHDPGGHGGHDMAAMDPPAATPVAGHSHDPGAHSGHDMAGHGGHMAGHGGHDTTGMELPGGVPMAERAEDRDGLILDRLRVPLGPALPDWPAGLSVSLTLQGDVVQQAAVRLYTAGGERAPWWTSAHAYAAAATDAHGGPDPVARLDSLQRLLFVAGWPAAALAARRIRDDLATGGTTTLAVRRAYGRWSHRVRRSRLLRWSTSGIGELGPEAPPDLRGDATARWLRWLDEVDTALAAPDEARERPVADAVAARAAVDALPRLLIGQELAVARLIVASLDPDVDALVAELEPAHG